MSTSSYIQATQEGHWKYTVDEWENGEYFKTIVSVFKESKIKNFIDIGANVGGVTNVLLNNVPTIETGYLFEPQKDNYNFLLNKFKDLKKIVCINSGIYYGESYLNLFKNENIGGFTIIKENDSSLLEEEYCSFFELEFFNFKPIDLVKMDIEGSEYNVIENSKFLQTVKFIEIEFHHREFDSNYISQYFPNHHIIWYSTWNNAINHILLKKNT